MPVLADVRHTVATLAHRTERCVRRYHERAGEQLAALVRVLPRRDALLGPQRQKMDDLGGRLDRALERRVTLARAQLDRDAGALRPAVLDHGSLPPRGIARRRVAAARSASIPTICSSAAMSASGAKATGKVVTTVAEAAGGGARLRSSSGMAR